ncbi:ATP-binding protein [Sneathiella glossodoripedis]|uniref:ATP-binding protein n=1 Tax=Sneathiella glossodoripedis TaxID=418853 RepID=UPI00131F28A3|nr:ATP-binding protein [Sneathiella glossodoripedis]
MSMKIGVMFGIATALLFHVPIEFESGIIADARSGPILMAGAIGGPIAAITTAVIAASARLHIGGAGAPAALVYICVFAATGVVWQYVCLLKNWSIVNPLSLIVVSSIGTLIGCSAVLTLPPEVQYRVLVSVMPIYWFCGVVGIWLLSLLIKREIERREFEERLLLEVERTARASQAKAKFLTAMSHEIRTPLNGILGIIQVVLQKHLPKQIDTELRVARESGFFLLGLLNQVLDFAKIEAGKSVIQKKDFCVESLVDGLRSIFHFQLHSKGLEFKTAIEPGSSGQFHGDLEHIQQVLFNLIGNATKFTAKGYVKLAVNFNPHSDAPYLEFVVSDTGTGIPANQLEKIFEEFEQVEGTNKLGGTGLGLSIAKGLCEDMDGEILVESTVGLGSKFTIRIPAEPVKNSPVTPILEEQIKIVTRSLSILVAEDNTVNQMVIKSLLAEEGHKVTIAQDGQDVVDKIASSPEKYDMILMDIQMPKLSGVEATEIIRATPLIPKDIPIVALTANAFIEQRAEYIAAGMNDVLIKPIQINELNRVLTEHFGEYSDIAKIELKAHKMNSDEIKKLCNSIGAKSVHDLLERAHHRSNTIMTEVKERKTTQSTADHLLHELKGMVANFGFDTVTRQIDNLRSQKPSTGELLQDIPDLDRNLRCSFTSAFDYVSTQLKN